jgi:hypothetical protein
VQTRFVVEADVLGDNAPEVILTEDEDVVEHLSAGRTSPCARGARKASYGPRITILMAVSILSR